jgi:hypothetical protein
VSGQALRNDGILRRSAPLLILLLVTSIAGCTGQFFVGDYYQPEPGEMVFGTDLDPSRSMVSNPSKSMPFEGEVAFVGWFPRIVTGTIRIDILKILVPGEPGEPFGSAGSFTAEDPGINYLSGEWQVSDFGSTGHYLVQMVLDSEVLAQGTLDLTTPPD